MTLYYASSAALTDTPSVVVSAEPIDRTVHLLETSGNSKFGFSDASVQWTLHGAPSSTSLQPHVFVLPAGHDLWGVADGGSGSGVRILVTSLGR